MRLWRAPEKYIAGAALDRADVEAWDDCESKFRPVRVLLASW
jgi:hypothetical protein